MNPIRYFKIRKELKRDQTFLLEKGLEKALSRNPELILSKEGNKLDITYLITNVADDYPRIAERYLENKEKLKKSLSCFSKT